MRVIVIISLIYFNTFPQAAGQTSTDTKNLITKLFTTNGYNKYVKPSDDLTVPLIVDVDLTLVSINGLDELEQKLTTTGYMLIAWEDVHLKWSSATYNGINSFSISQTEVWRPDIAVQNGFNKLKELGSDFLQVSVHSNGIVKWMPFEVFETKCSVNTKYFPFDEQTCDIIFVVWSGTSSDILVTVYQDGIQLENIEEDGMWTVQSTSAREVVESSVSKLRFTINLKRNPSYYVYNLILPIVFLSVLTVFTFVLPADSGEKMGYSMTVFLSFAVFLTILSAELPKTPGAILAHYMMFELVVNSFIVFCTALELRIHHRKDPVPLRVQRLIKLACCRFRRNVVMRADKENDEDEMTWDDVISKVDFVLFWLMLFLTFFATSIFMIILTYNL